MSQSSSQPVKFTFERRFEERRRPGFVYSEEEKTITRSAFDEAVAAAHAEGVAQGRQQGAQEARAEEAARLGRAVESIASTLQLLARDLSQIEEAATGEAIQAALAFSSRLAGDLATRLPVDRIEEAMASVMRDMRGAPHIALRVAPDLVEAARIVAEKLAREQGYEGRLIVLGDPDAKPGDAQIEWSEGGVLVRREETEQTLAALVRRLVDGIADNH